MKELFDTPLGTPQSQAVASLRKLAKTVPMYALAEFTSESKNAPPLFSMELNYFGTTVLVGTEEGDEAAQAELDAKLADKRALYASAIENAPNPRVEEFGGQAGDHVSEAALTATQQAQKLYAAAMASSLNCPIRFVFEFNGAKVDFNPFEDAEQVVARVREVFRKQSERYEQSEEYAAIKAKSEEEVANLQKQERLLRESVTDELQKPLANVVEFVRKYGECVDRSGVTVYPEEIVTAFVAAGFKPNAFTGSAYHNSALSSLETRTRYWVGQFLDTLPRKHGLPGIFFSMGEELSKSYAEEVNA